MDIDYARPSAEAARLRRWQAVTLSLLLAGYAGYYLCRSHFSATKPLILQEMVDRHWASAADAKAVLGDIAAVGTLLYAIGKFVAGFTGDLFGGRWNFLLGMVGAIAFTLLFAVSGWLPLFTIAWGGNRLLQAFGWPGVVKIGGRWTPYRRHGFVMGLLSLSYLFGDAAARLFMGVLMAQGLGWRGVFAVNAAVLGAVFVATYLLLRESPTAAGLPEFPPSPRSVYDEGPTAAVATAAAAGTAAATAGPNATRTEHAATTLAYPTSSLDYATPSADGPPRVGRPVVDLLLPLLGSPAFWVVCGLSLATTLARETFNDWTPTYFVERLGLAPADAAASSAWFPLLGGCSVLAFGHLSDRFGRAGRAACLTVGLGLCGAAMWLLAAATTAAVAVPLVAVVAFLLIGPYSFLAGSIALDFGGRTGGATAAGLIDGVGYLAGVLAGSYVARLATAHGWGAAFGMLAVVTWVATGLGVVYCVLQLRTARAHAAEDARTNDPAAA